MSHFAPIPPGLTKRNLSPVDLPYPGGRPLPERPTEGKFFPIHLGLHEMEFWQSHIPLSLESQTGVGLSWENHLFLPL